MDASARLGRMNAFAPITYSRPASFRTEALLSRIQKRATKLQLRPFVHRRSHFREFSSLPSTTQTCAPCSPRLRSEATAESPLSTDSSPTDNLTECERDPLESAGEGLYTPFVDYCVRAMSDRMDVTPFPIKPSHRVLHGVDGSVSRSTALQSRKLRMMRSADISAGPNLQVLNLVIFPRPEYDLPFFCADLVTFPKGHLVVLDLNPLFSSESYLSKYIAPVLPACARHAQHLPWGGEFTAEALQFFSPALIWARLPLTDDVQTSVFDCYKEYLQLWLDMVENAVPVTDPERITAVKEAQHRYMCWRCEKDPGRPVLTKLFGEERCEDYIHNFLFDGYQDLGTKTFLDYFPLYRGPDGSVLKKRSVAGRAYSTRPWDDEGRFIGNAEE